MSQDEGIHSLTTLLRNGFSSMMHGVHTMMPGKVISYANQRATIELGIAPVLDDGTKLPYPPLIEVPIQFTRFGGYSITMPVNAGDTVAVFFCERSMTNWLQRGIVGEAPDTARFFSLSDAFAVPGLWPESNPVTQDSSLRIQAENASVSVVLAKDGNVTVHSGAADMVLTPAGKFTVTNATGELNAITQGMLEILTAAVPAPSLSAYNSLKSQRSSFVL